MLTVGQGSIDLLCSKVGSIDLLCSQVGIIDLHCSQVCSIDLREGIPTADIVFTGDLPILSHTNRLNGLALWMTWDLGIVTHHLFSDSVAFIRITFQCTFHVLSMVFPSVPDPDPNMTIQVTYLVRIQLHKEDLPNRLKQRPSTF
jgi:hypothetical protein